MRDENETRPGAKPVKLVFVHGMPGVGKLTVARELAELTGFKLFHNHLTVDLVGSVFPFGSAAFVELRESIWLDVFSRAAAAKVPGLIFTFAYDRTVRPEFVEKLLCVVEAKGVEVVFVELKCSPEELERRVAHPSRQRFGKLHSLALFRELNEAGAFVDPGIPAERLVLDITIMAPRDTARLITSKLQNPER
ncbi:MAG: AAA family ATPase [Acidobacteriota bacterium]